MEVRSCRHTYTYKKTHMCAHPIFLTLLHMVCFLHSVIHTHTHTQWSVSIVSFSLMRPNTCEMERGFAWLTRWDCCECACVSVHVHAYSHMVENQFLCCQLRLAQPVVISLATSLLAGLPANKINLRSKGNWRFQWEYKSIWGKGGREW